LKRPNNNSGNEKEKGAPMIYHLNEEVGKLMLMLMLLLVFFYISIFLLLIFKEKALSAILGV